MRRHAPVIAALALLLAVGACGQDAETGSDPGSGPAPTTRTTPTDPASPAPRPAGDAAVGEQVAIVTQTAVGGSVSTRATALPDDAAVQAYAARFSRPGVGEQIAQAVAAADVSEGQSLWAAVVAVGCDVPTSVQVTVEAGAVVVVPEPAASPGRQCVAPMTSVAVVLADVPS